MSKRGRVWMAICFLPGGIPVASAVSLRSEVQTLCERLLPSCQRHWKSGNTSSSISPHSSFIRLWIMASEGADPLLSCWLCYAGGKLQQRWNLTAKNSKILWAMLVFGQGSSSMHNERWLHRLAHCKPVTPPYKVCTPEGKEVFVTA